MSGALELALKLGAVELAIRAVGVLEDVDGRMSFVVVMSVEFTPGDRAVPRPHPQRRRRGVRHQPHAGRGRADRDRALGPDGRRDVPPRPGGPRRRGDRRGQAGLPGPGRPGRRRADAEARVGPAGLVRHRQRRGGVHLPGPRRDRDHRLAADRAADARRPRDRHPCRLRRRHQRLDRRGAASTPRSPTRGSRPSTSPATSRCAPVRPGFLFTAGGFYPGFPVPAGLGEVRRLAISLSPSPILQIRAEAYFALTASTVQFGGGLAVVAELGPIGARGGLDDRRADQDAADAGVHRAAAPAASGSASRARTSSAPSSTCCSRARVAGTPARTPRSASCSSRCPARSSCAGAPPTRSHRRPSRSRPRCTRRWSSRRCGRTCCPRRTAAASCSARAPTRSTRSGGCG